MAVRQRMIDSIERMVRAECEASGSPRPPDVDYFDQYPLTDNHLELTDRITSAFRSHFGKEPSSNLDVSPRAKTSATYPMRLRLPIPTGEPAIRIRRSINALSMPGGVDQDIPVNHSEFFALVIEPAQSTGIEALVIAALAYFVK